MVTHDINTAIAQCTHVGALLDGSFIFTGTSREFASRCPVLLDEIFSVSFERYTCSSRNAKRLAHGGSMPLMKRPMAMIVLLSVLTIAAVIVCPMIGIRWISPLCIMHDSDLRFIFLNIRIPRTLVSLFVGGGLAVAGMIYQAIFRNPLADPYTLGVSSGASLGAAVCIVAGVGGTAFDVGSHFWRTGWSCCFDTDYLCIRVVTRRQFHFAPACRSSCCDSVLRFYHVHPLCGRFA